MTNLGGPGIPGGEKVRQEQGDPGVETPVAIHANVDTAPAPAPVVASSEAVDTAPTPPTGDQALNTAMAEINAAAGATETGPPVIENGQPAVDAVTQVPIQEGGASALVHDALNTGTGTHMQNLEGGVGGLPAAQEEPPAAEILPENEESSQNQITPEAPAARVVSSPIIPSAPPSQTFEDQGENLVIPPPPGSESGPADKEPVTPPEVPPTAAPVVGPEGVEQPAEIEDPTQFVDDFLAKDFSYIVEKNPDDVRMSLLKANLDSTKTHAVVLRKSLDDKTIAGWIKGQVNQLEMAYGKGII